MNVFSGQKILVVEDNFMSFKLLEAHFMRANLEIIHASDGLMALELFRLHEDVALILMDIQLPGMNGLEVTRAIREINTEVPIIAATANVFDDDKTACLDAGCTDFVTKPINFQRLFELLDKRLN
jgi:CheY-like chemotaxis protein